MSCCFKTDLRFDGRTGFDLTPSFSGASGLDVTFSDNVVVSSDRIFSDTTDGWNSQPHLIAVRNAIYVYTDYQQTQDGQGNTVFIPGLKIGDGTSYLIDMPFTDDLMVQHMANGDIHVTLEEKAFWNSKVRAYESDDENLVLTTL